jgi:hypothetical protein
MKTLLRLYGRSVLMGSLLMLGGLPLAASASDEGIGAQARPDLSFADVEPVRVFHVATGGNDANPGTAEQPWRTVQHAVNTLRPGDAARIQPGEYRERVTITHEGTPTAPIQLLAASKASRPVLLGAKSDRNAGNPMLRIRGTHWVVEGLDLQLHGDKAKAVAFQGAHHVVVRDSEMAGGTEGSGVAFFEGARDIGFLRNKVHHFIKEGDDSHGMLVLPDTQRILLQGNESFANSGDSFQCQGPDVTPGRLLPVDITVEGNRFHEDQENAVDIKTCDRVTVRDNKFFGYKPPRDGRARQGAAMVVHYSARRILLERNRIFRSGRGLSLGGNIERGGDVVTDVIVRRNLVFDGTTTDGGSGDGLRVGSSRRVRLLNNTLAFLPVGGIKLGDGDHGPARELEVQNNIVFSTRAALTVSMSGVRDLVSDHNLFSQPGSTTPIRMNGREVGLEAWRTQSGQDRTSLSLDPLFLDDPRNFDFFTKPGSPARDVAEALALAGSVSICGAGMDLGFLETCP